MSVLHLCTACVYRPTGCQCTVEAVLAHPAGTAQVQVGGKGAHVMHRLYCMIHTMCSACVYCPTGRQCSVEAVLAHPTGTAQGQAGGKGAHDGGG
jgi:hypothetical protein